MRVLLVLVLCLTFAGVVSAEQKHNPYSGKWETVPDSSWQPKYNPYENDWSYQPEDATIEHNPYENKWEWDSGHNAEED